MIKVDILSPVGGLHGGVENVIKGWTKHLDMTEYDLRIIHMTPGTAYLDGYPKAYSFSGSDKAVDMDYYVDKYSQFISAYGQPDICVATNWPLIVLAACMARDRVKGGFKVVSWVHNKVEIYHNAGLGGYAHMSYADAHLVISNNTKNKLVAQNDKAKVYVVNNPVKIETNDEARNVNGDTICYVGRLEQIKRVDLVIEAVYRSKYPWKLKIVGTGEDEEELKACVDYLKLGDRVTFYGWQNKPWECCSDAIALVNASEYEGFPLIGIEAMSKGMMVISTPVEGIVDYVKPGENGYLFDFDDACGLGRILDMLWEKELPICEPDNCIQTAGRYSEEEYYNRLDKFLKEIYLDEK